MLQLGRKSAMSNLITCQSVSKTFGSGPLFENVSLALSEGERIGFIGPNGSGKSTLMQILAGIQIPDEGNVSWRKGLRLGYVPQEPLFPPDATALSVVLDALDQNAGDEHEREVQASIALSRVGFADTAVRSASLSGGWRKRLALARELAREPDALLLDEPTNHLDLEGILWLEQTLAAASFACLVVSHDRYFLENVATDVAEINRIYPDGLFRVRGAYSEFLLKRENFLHAQTKEQEALENQVRKEVEWLRRGPKARTSKSRARIDTAQRMIGDLADLKARTAERSADIEWSASGRKTRKLIATEGLSKEYDERTLFRDLEILLRPGMRLGLAGPNGSGKTTLLRIFAGEVKPDRGEVMRADGLRIVYFDQHRAKLDEAISLRRTLAPDGDSVIYRDRTIHVAGWARRFLFRADQLDVAVGRLSGGERARAVIARLMLQPADVLLLDEPTNDIDIPTLEVLEESLMEFPGALVLVTHDRYLLDRVSTAVLGLSGDGRWGLFADYSQWEQFGSDSIAAEADVKPKTVAAEPASPTRKKLSYMEAREYDTIEHRIHDAERRLAHCQTSMEDPLVMGDPSQLQAAYDSMQTVQAEVDQLYERWAELEEKLAGSHA